MKHFLSFAFTFPFISHVLTESYLSNFSYFFDKSLSAKPMGQNTSIEVAFLHFIIITSKRNYEIQ